MSSVKIKNKGVISVGGGNVLNASKNGFFLYSLETGESKKVGVWQNDRWWDIQILYQEDTFIVLSFSTNEVVLINKQEFTNITVPNFQFPYFNLLKKIGRKEVLFDRGWLGYYVLDLDSKEYSKYSSLMVTKYYYDFRTCDSNLFPIRTNPLFIDKDYDKVLYHFHGSKSLQEIGVYSISDQSFMTKFMAPEPIQTVNWYSDVKSKENTNIYSNIRGGITLEGNIILCYKKMLYLMDGNGQILMKRGCDDNKRYFDLVVDKNKVYFSELNEISNEMDILVLDDSKAVL